MIETHPILATIAAALAGLFCGYVLTRAMSLYIAANL